MTQPLGVPFAHALIAWQKQHGRHHLPWQNTRDPYRIWLSEIMLQQTQVAAVVPYYERFLARFPTLQSLAQGTHDDVMALWSGLGYYARARNLHRCAQVLCAEHAGRFPPSAALIATLPGIGRSTAAAIAAFAFGERAAILDGNVKRVLCRHFAVEGFPGQAQVEKSLWALAEQLLPEQGIEAYTQSLMDLGATVCQRSKPHCMRCPVQASCLAHRQKRTDTLPTPRPARMQPQRYALLLVLQRDSAKRGAEIFLEQRPAQGIWGGLWSLPQLDINATEFAQGIRSAPASSSTVQALQGRVIARLQTLGVMSQQVQAIEEWPALTHAFTHFRLSLLPVHVRLQGALPLRSAGESATLPASDSRRQGWIFLAGLDQIGLPAPVRRLLDTFK